MKNLKNYIESKTDKEIVDNLDYIYTEMSKLKILDIVELYSLILDNTEYSDTDYISMITHKYPKILSVNHDLFYVYKLEYQLNIKKINIKECLLIINKLNNNIENYYSLFDDNQIKNIKNIMSKFRKDKLTQILK